MQINSLHLKAYLKLAQPGVIGVSIKLKHHLKHIVRLWMLFMAVLVSPHAYALGLGEILVNSNLGEPLKARVELIEVTAADAQDLKAHLASMEAYRKNGLQYPEGVKFSFQLVNEQNAQPFVRITTTRPIEDLFVDLLIEVSSPSGKISKSYTILLDPPPDLSRSPQAGVQPAETQQTAQAESRQPDSINMPARTPGGDTVAAAAPEKPVKSGYRRKDRGYSAKLASEQTTDMPAKTEGSPDTKKRNNKLFGKLSLSLSMSLSISKSDPGAPASLRDSKDALQEELIAKEKTLNELNAQIAEMQGMIKALKSLQDKPGANQAASGTAGAGISAEIGTASSVSVVSEESNKPQLPETAIQRAAEEGSKPDKLLKQNWAGLASGMAVLLSVTGFIWYRKRKQKLKHGLFDDFTEAPKTPVAVLPSANVAVNLPEVAQSAKPPGMSDKSESGLPTGPQSSPAASEIEQARSTAPSDEVTNTEGLPSPSSAQLTRDADELAEVDSMIEEAELYAIYGHQDKAIEMLNDIILKCPEKVEVWLLLLSTFRNKKNARQFESVARKFLATMGCHDAWKDIQEAGRSIDPDNPLYFDADGIKTTNAQQSIKPKKHRLLGEILIDMNAISAHDLENSLANFDHMRDGRLGNYLVTSGLINQEQLVEALQQQHKEMAAEPHPSSAPTYEPLIKAGKPRSIGDVLVQMGMVTEPELEQALFNYDPKRYGHCGAYLVACKIITKEQLYTALLQQLGGAMAVEFATPTEQSPAEAEQSTAEADNFIPWDLPTRSIR